MTALNRVTKADVCHVTSVHKPFDIRIFRKQCRSLATSGFNVILVATGDDGTFVHDGVQLILVPSRKGRFRRLFISSFEVTFKALKQRATIYQFHDPELLPHALMIALVGRRVIFDFHEDYELKLREREWLSVSFRKLAVLGFCLLSRLGDWLFAAKLAATPVIASKHKAKRVEVIANYPLLDMEESLDRIKDGSPAATPAGCKLIYTGGWTANRGARQLVAALPYITAEGVRMTVIGQTELDERAVISELPGFRLVDEKGRVPYEQAIAEMQSADIGLVCSQYGHGYDQALPNKLFEYMALGLPVIASDFPMWRELLEKEDCVLFVDPSDPKAIADAIDYLAANPALRRRMGENGNSAVKRRFNWQVEEQKLIRLYEEVLSCS